MLFGVETLTLERTTPYVGVSFVLPVRFWEVRSALRYGLPAEEETAETVEGAADVTSSRQTRGDFGAFELALCRGSGGSWRVSLCAGGELGVVRVDHRRRQGDVEVDSDDDRTRVAGIATARLVGSAGMVRPELEFSALAASVGLGATPSLGLRLGARLALQF